MKFLILHFICIFQFTLEWRSFGGILAVRTHEPSVFEKNQSALWDMRASLRESEKRMVSSK
jgi:hypothetical protein